MSYLFPPFALVLGEYIFPWFLKDTRKKSLRPYISGKIFIMPPCWGRFWLNIYLEWKLHFFFLIIWGHFPIVDVLAPRVALEVSLFLLLICFSFWISFEYFFASSFLPMRMFLGLDPFLSLDDVRKAVSPIYYKLLSWEFSWILSLEILCLILFYLLFFPFFSHFLLYFVGRFPQFYLETHLLRFHFCM